MTMNTVPPIIPQASLESPPIKTTQKEKTFAPALSSAISERSPAENSNSEKTTQADSPVNEFSSPEKTVNKTREHSDSNQETDELEQLQPALSYSEVISQQLQDSSCVKATLSTPLLATQGTLTDQVKGNRQNTDLQQQQQLPDGERIAIKIASETKNFTQGQNTLSGSLSSHEKELSLLQAPSINKESLSSPANISQDKTVNSTAVIAKYNPKDNIILEQRTNPRLTSITFNSSSFSRSSIFHNGVAAQSASTLENISQTGVSTESVMASLTDLTTDNIKPLRNSNAITLRQEIANQHMDARIKESSITVQQNDTNPNFGKNQGETNQQQTFFQSPYQSSFSDTTAHQFIQPTHTVTGETTATNSTSHLSPLTSPQFTEDSIVNQVTEKFRISRIINDSKLTLKLHPAELGDLKIDIQVKDNTVNATIVAQSVKVQEIIEKNTSRLREILQEQGLTLDDLTIRIEDDSAKQYTMTDDQLMQNGHNFSRENSSSQTLPAFTLLQEEATSESEDTEHVQTISANRFNDKSVNVTI